MIQIAKQAYTKSYNFSYFSDAMALKVILYLLAIVLPFFVVYSIPRFYLNFIDNVSSRPIIAFDYNYHLSIQTTSNIYIYTTLYTSQNNLPISLSYELDEHKQIHNFQVNWQKPLDQAVKRVVLTVFMKYSNGIVTDGYGMIVGEVEGINMADISMISEGSIKTGDSLSNVPPTTNMLPTYDYDIGETLTSLKTDYSAYLASSTSAMAINLPTTELTLKMKLNTGAYSFTQTNASILGQFVWSWAQYFPLAFILWYLATITIEFVLRENILKRYLIHDPSYRHR